MRAALCGRPLSRAARRARVATFRSTSSVTASSAIRIGSAGRVCSAATALRSTAHIDQVALQPGDLGCVHRGGVDAAVEPSGRGEHDGRLPERRQHAPDVLEERAARADHQHAAAGQLLAVGVEQVGHAVQRDRGLPGARAALDHDDATPAAAGSPRPARPGSWRRCRASPSRAARTARPAAPGRPRCPRIGVVEARGEDVVVDVDDPFVRGDPGELEMPSADHSHRARQRGAVERPGRGRPPVEQRRGSSWRRPGSVSPTRPT